MLKIKLHNGHCIDNMKVMKEKGVLVDAIITDPPFNISRKNNFHTMKGFRHGIDFGEWDKGFNQFTWLDHADALLKKGGNLIIFNSWQNIGNIAKYLEEKLGYEIKDVIRWVKNNPMPRNRDRRYVSDYELAIWLVKKGGKWTFNRQAEKFQRPEFIFPIVGGKEKEGHPTQKSLRLMEELIKIHTNEGDIVLDPFAGSGTTGEACVIHKRNFIGIELDKNYFDIMSNRLSKLENRPSIEETETLYNPVGLVVQIKTKEL